MATNKKTDEVQNDAEMQAELEEVRETAPEVDLPGEAEVNQPVVEIDDSTEESGKTTKAGKRSAKAQREAEEETARLAAKDEAKDEPDAPKAPRRQMPNPLKQHGKKYREAAAKVERTKHYELSEALELARQTATTKFDSSLELHIGLGVDPRQADQMVRASVVLPHGTGRTLRVAVLAPEAKHADANAAGADIVGIDNLLSDIEAGKLDFDMLVATPDMMARLGKLAKVLGPRGLMPNPKSGTVTPDVAKAVREAKAGKVEFRIDKQAIIHQGVGKISFSADDMLANVRAMINAVMQAKPAASKGTYVKNMSISTTMGPGIKLDVTQAIASAATKK